MMRELIATLLLCIIASVQVESSIITVDTLSTSETDSAVSIDTKNYIGYDEEFEYEGVYEYSVSFNDSHPDADALPLKWMYIDESNNIVVSGDSTICDADLTTPEGTVAAIVAKALGIMSDTVCPREGSEFTQKSVFQMDGGDFSNLPNSSDPDDLMSVKLDVFSSTYLRMRLSITDNTDWFDEDEAVDPDQVSDGDGGEGDSSNDPGEDEEPADDDNE